MTTVAQQAVEAAMEVECKKDSLKQNQDGTWKFTLTIAPGGLPDAMMKAAPGTRYTAVFVEVNDQEEPVKHAPAASKKPRRPFHELPLSQQAALRCQDERFCQFLVKQHNWTSELDEGGSAGFIYDWCTINSRADLDTDDQAAADWLRLNAEYGQWAGLSAEAR